MNLITFFTKLLHLLPSEISHFVALKGIKALYSLGLLRYLLIKNKNNSSEKKLKENLAKKLKFSNIKNRIGIAAGLDKNGEYIDCLASMGVGFIEVGTVTPKAQKGNPRPRLFRNNKDKSLVNRLGFNNKGVDHLAEKLQNKKTDIIVGSSIGKNFDTPNEEAYKDYLYCLEKIYHLSDYIAINISSPNTKSLRDLSSKENLDFLLEQIKSKQNKLSSLYGHKPIYIKISPDEDTKQIEEICSVIIKNKIDGIICSNTTINHTNINGPGGLSGAPLKNLATEKLLLVKKFVGNELPIIASGGVMSVPDYKEKLEAGADLVQLYTGFIYAGPKLINDIARVD